MCPELYVEIVGRDDLALQEFSELVSYYFTQTYH